jgi:hypothetical protein
MTNSERKDILDKFRNPPKAVDWQKLYRRLGYAVLDLDDKWWYALSEPAQGLARAYCR